MKCYAVDRVEGAIAVLEDLATRKTYNVPMRGAREGQIYCISKTGRLSRNRALERRRMAETRRILEQLKRTDPGGDIRL